MSRWSRSLAAGLAALVVLAGCGGPDDETTRPVVTTTAAPETPQDLPDLPVGDADVEAGDRVRVRDGVLRVNGSRIDLSSLQVREAVAVPGGVYFRNGTELWFTDLLRARTTPFTDVRSLVAADGRMAFIDLEHGVRDRFGTPLATVIAYDARTGKPLVASYAGMGDYAADDLATLYRSDPPEIRGIRADHLDVHGPAGDYRVPLDGSDPQPLPAPTR